MEPMRVVWAGVVVVMQAPAPRPGPWAGPAAADHARVLSQVSAWLTGLRQGVQAAPPLPAFEVGPLPRRAEPAAEQSDAPLPGFYL